MFLLSTQAFSVDSKNDKLKFCSTADWPPYEAVDTKTGKVEGMSVELVKKIFDNNVEITPLPWERCLEMNKQGEVDGVFSVSRNDEREKYLIFPQEDIMKASYVFVVLKDTDCKYCETDKNIMSLPQPLGGPLGYSVIKKLKKEVPQLKIDDSAPGDEVNIDKLLAGRVKSIIINQDVLKEFGKKKNVMSRLKILNPPYVDGKPYYIGVSKKYKGLESEAQKLAERISAALKKIKVKA